MPASISWLLEIFKDSTGHWNWPWIGAALVAAGTVIATITSALWAIFKFFAERKKAEDKKRSDRNVTQSGQGTASGRDTNFQGPVTFAPSPEFVEQIQKPWAEQLAAKDTQFAALHSEYVALTKMLLEKSPAATGPGAQQAVGEAVQSIAEGAAEGDGRLQHALALLKANKIAEAELLLKAFAEDKTARAEQDRKEAAIAYRNLGAIAALHDPKSAREAYARAVALDPENAEGLYWDGWFQLDAKNLAAAEKSYRALIQLAGKGANEHQIFWAGTGLGDIAVARGDLNAALASYDEARSEMERLAKSDPGNTDWQRDLSVSYARVGDVQVAQGNLAGALKSYSDDLAIADRLATSDPGNAGWQRDLSVSYNKVGDVQVAQGNLAGALKSYSDSLAIADRLEKSDPGNAGWRRDLSVSYEKVGDVQVAQGDLAGALNSYSDSLAIRARLANSDLGNAGWQRDLSVSYEKVGGVQEAQGNLPGALKSYSNSLAIRDRLAKSDPGNAGWQRDLSVSYNKVGDVQVAQGNLAGALKSYSDGLAIIDRLANAAPVNAGWQRDRSFSFGRLALVHRQSGDKAKALGFLRDGQAIMARLTKLSPDNAIWKNDLAWFDGEIKELGP